MPAKCRLNVQQVFSISFLHDAHEETAGILGVKMTYNEIYQKFRETVVASDVEDYRPDVFMHTKDIKALPEGAGIVIWMKNGDGILYYPSEILKNKMGNGNG